MNKWIKFRALGATVPKVCSEAPQSTRAIGQFQFLRKHCDTPHFTNTANSWFRVVHGFGITLHFLRCCISVRLGLWWLLCIVCSRNSEQRQRESERSAHASSDHSRYLGLKQKRFLLKLKKRIIFQMVTKLLRPKCFLSCLDPII